MTATVKVLPSDDAVDAVEGLEKLVRGRVPDPAHQPPGDEFFRGDFSALWSSLVDNGWTGLAAPGRSRTDDAEGLDIVDLLAVAEMWGRYLVPLPFLPTLITSRWSDAGSPAGAGATFALWSDHHGYAISPFGGVEGVRCVAAVPGGGGDVAMDVPRLDLSAPSLPVARAVAPSSIGVDVRREVAALALAEAVGAATVTLERAIAYAGVRVQFGKPIGSQQAVKHHLANMHIANELARSTSLSMLYADGADLPGLVRNGFGYCSTVWQTSVQVHGGIGFTWEAGLHFYERHVLALRALAVAAVQAGNGPA